MTFAIPKIVAAIIPPTIAGQPKPAAAVPAAATLEAGELVFEGISEGSGKIAAFSLL